MIFEKYKIFSLLDDKPVIFYDPVTSRWLAYWFGHFMLAEHALAICAELYWDNPCGKDVKNTIDDQFRLLFDFPHITDLVDLYVSDKFIYHNILCRVREMVDQNKLNKKYEKSEVYRWFNNMLTNNHGY